MKLPLLGILLVTVAGCGRTTLDRTPEHPPEETVASAIRGGTTDNGHDAVVLIYNHIQGYLCTGTVIDEQTILTAAHCVDDSRVSAYDIAGGTNPFNQATWVMGAREVHMHPDYSTTQIGIHDVGIILLDADAPVTPYTWQKVVDDPTYDIGTDFTAVGYGVTNESSNDSGIKRQVSLTIADVGSDAYAFGGPTRNICSGDSGGPDLLGTHVIGVHSYGNIGCDQFGASMRTDDNADFIAQYVTENGGGGGDGCGCTLEPRARPASSVWLLALALGAFVATRRR